ncbi:TPA: hypothetical protein ACHWKL_001219 [Providencia stuartii]|uniref:Uncharacterized protein n=11 Tax=Providencia TaxID=586 RepID=A0AAJ1JDE2_PROST|nr:MULTISPECIES: hypothetical protein [Providencia]SST01142.1 Uncharacterised protein [Acinetobacter baumannii]AFH91955.1 hypothetical protein S70_00260 [Providencia stuartii MRSN 2154]AIN62687.1 hypothetical protein DR96_3198 [Providencia stuartii]APG50009.1 hypothetical protein BGK56_03235 [Providencia stuartii]AVE43479.1 hypothetical protein AM353_17510 [Providencia stuartii]
MKELTLKEVKLVSGGTFNLCKPPVTTTPKVSVQPSVPAPAPTPVVKGVTVTTTVIKDSYNFNAIGNNGSTFNVTY